MSLRKAFVVSLLLHLLFFYLISKTPFLLPETEDKHREIIARLIEPEKGPIVKPVQRPRPGPELKKPPMLKKKTRKTAKTSKTEPPTKKSTKETMKPEPATKIKEKTEAIKKVEPSKETKKAQLSTESLEQKKTEQGMIESPVLKRHREESTESGIPHKGGAVRIPSGRELLDKDIIGGIAKNYVKRSPPPKEGGITFNTRDLKYYSYMMKLKERIESIWVYPPEAIRRGIYGDLWILFTIRKDGSLGEVKLLRTSGYPELDEAAMRALKEGAPYWPLPEKWKEEALTIKGHFIYSLYGMYIR
ncbi:MAG: TonB family protein [Nitrospirae bacterium]|nr:TonB family protein [Nitrospirota bacterium]